MEVTINSVEALENWMPQFVDSLSSKTVILLAGEMGAGKTQFVKSLCKHLGFQDTDSPSFAIHNEYNTPVGTVDHLDLYRLESEEELEATGFWDLFLKPKGLIIVEWPERMNHDDLPPDWHQISLEISVLDDLTSRKIKQLQN